MKFYEHDNIIVAPCTGAWIETAPPSHCPGRVVSPLVQGRGLKLIKEGCRDALIVVAPCTGAWIETYPK